MYIRQRQNDKMTGRKIQRYKEIDRDRKRNLCRRQIDRKKEKKNVWDRDRKRKIYLERKREKRYRIERQKYIDREKERQK